MWFCGLLVELSCVLRFIATLVTFAFRRDKEYNGIKVLKIGPSIKWIWPLENLRKFF